MALEEIPPNFDVAFLSYIKEQKQLLEMSMLDGRARTYDEYRYMVGQLRGVTIAENAFNDLVLQWNNR